MSLARLLESRVLLPIVAALTFFSRLALSLRPNGSLASRLYLDDSFYVLAIARHLAKGLGLTADGINPTNGLQPLIACIFAPCFWIAGGDRWLGLRLTFIPLAIIDAISVLLVYGIVRVLDRSERSRLSAALAVIFWLVSYPMWSETMNGLETGIYTCLLLLGLYLLLTDAKIGLTGAVLGLCVLARIDAVFFIGLIVIYLLINGRTKDALTIGVASFLMSLPWWYYNWSVFGSLMPSSGYAQSVGAIPLLQNLRLLGVSMADIGTVLFALPLYRFSESIEWLWALLGTAFLLLVLYRARVWMVRLQPDARAFLFLFTVFGALLGAIYALFFHAPYFIHRYVQPLRIIVMIIAAITMMEWIGRSGMRKLASATIVAFGLFYGGFFYHHIMTARNDGDLFRAGVWARAHQEAKVGMLQSGIAGFTADNVINLDGKVNSDALDAIRADSLGQYIVSQRFTHLMDWDEFARRMVAEATSAGGCYRLVDSISLVRIYEACDK